MATLTLIIKGAQHMALGAAKAREIPLLGAPRYFKRPASNGGPYETALRVDAIHIDAVARWFIEPPHAGPYPIGTLLFYSYDQETL